MTNISYPVQDKLLIDSGFGLQVKVNPRVSGLVESNDGKGLLVVVEAHFADEDAPVVDQGVDVF